VDHVKFILRTEREGNLITTDHYFNKNLEKAGAKRLNAAAKKVIEPRWDQNSRPMSVIKVDNIMRVAGMSNLQHTVGYS
jgi:hypothetical protein